jgi:hypothetical protein
MATATTTNDRRSQENSAPSSRTKVAMADVFFSKIRATWTPNPRAGSRFEKTAQMGLASISKSCCSRTASARSAALNQSRMRIRRLATRSCAASNRSSRTLTRF